MHTAPVHPRAHAALVHARFSRRSERAHAAWLGSLLLIACSQADEGIELALEPGTGAAAGPIAAAAAPAPSDNGSTAVTPQVDGRQLADDLSVSIQNETHMRLESLVLPCAAECVGVVAVATGGHPPYTYVWSDGLEGPEREICRSTLGPLQVTATDSGRAAIEFGVPPAEVTATVSTRTVSCEQPAEPSEADAEMPTIPPACRAPEPVTCAQGDGPQLPDEVTVDVQGSPRFFVDGAELPAGRYRLRYVDGCNTYGIGAGWTVHGLDNVGDFASCNVVDGSGAHVARTPGTTGIFVDPTAATTAFATYEACVEANCALAPIDFDFAGGQLAVRRDGVFVGSIDDAGGEAVGGRSPTFRLTSLDSCR